MTHSQQITNEGSKMTKFEDLEFSSVDRTGCIGASIMFQNGYGASVIRGPHSYGGPAGLYELAVIDDGGLVYDTPITDDVRGWLTEEEVTVLLAEIEALPARTEVTIEAARGDAR